VPNRQKIDIKRTVLERAKYDLLVDRTFQTFRTVVEPTVQASVEDFFEKYETLYADIPVIGDLNSHEYLIKKSSELISIETSLEDIQPLLDEVAQLREQLLQANTRIFELEDRLVQIR
jgi:hypothetical protein